MGTTNQVRLILILAVAVLAVTRGGQFWAVSAAQRTAQAAAGQETIQMQIAGMTCASCAEGLEASFRNMAGVVKATVDYKAGQALVTFDANKQTAESLARFVANCGYKVKETKVV
jgi:copper chaperone CopZ